MNKEKFGATAKRSWRENTKPWKFSYGRKSKNANLSIKIIVISVGLLGITLSFFKEPVKVKVRAETIEIPDMSSPKSKLTIPEYTPKETDLKKDRASQTVRVQRRDTRFEPIKVIQFSDLKDIPPGAQVKARLVSGGTNGTLKAVLTENLRIDGETYLRKGTVLLGQGSSSDDRLFINFTSARAPGSNSRSIRAEGFDANDKFLGLKGKKISDHAFKITASSGLIFLGAMAEGLQTPDSGNPFRPERKSIRDAALQGVATSSVEQGRRIIDNMDNASKVEVKFNTPLIIIFSEDDNE